MSVLSNIKQNFYVSPLIFPTYAPEIDSLAFAANASLMTDAAVMISPLNEIVIFWDHRIVRVKAIYLYFADRFWPSTASKLNLKKIDSGSGKRAICRGGTYHYYPKYMLS